MSTVVERLQQLITALDARHVQPGRPEEAGIAASSREMRAKAVAKLKTLAAGGAADPAEEVPGS